jgi:hypothetical protein
MKLQKSLLQAFGLENSMKSGQISIMTVAYRSTFFMYPGQELCTFDPKVIYMWTDF